MPVRDKDITKKRADLTFQYDIIGLEVCCGKNNMLREQPY